MYTSSVSLYCLMKGKHMNASPMNDEFHDWLDQCPVRWIRDRLEKEYVYYCFEITDEENEDEL